MNKNIFTFQKKIFLFFLVVFYFTNLFSGVAIRDLLFKKGEIIHFCFISGSDEDQTTVKDVGKVWLKYANVQFDFLQFPCKDVPQNLRENLVRITINFETDFKSYTGRAMNRILFPEPTMWLISSFPGMGYSNQEKTRIFHEFGHVLGLEHEHFHPEIQKQMNNSIIQSCRNQNQKWTEEQCKWNLISPWKPEEIILDEFNKDSIMMYNLRIYSELLGEYNRKYFISPKDILFIQKLYPK